MKKVSTFSAFFIGLLVFILLAGRYPTQPATATGPTPTPTAVMSGPFSQPAQPCRLELGMKCDLSHLRGTAPGRSEPRYNPTLEAREVPTYTLISTTFIKDMDPDTINNDTFYVNQGANRLSGAIRYISPSRMAVFYPESPLTPNTTYTATVARGVRDSAGEPLAEERRWSFTTVAAGSAWGSGLTLAGASAVDGRLNVYFGDLHSHTGYSDGQGTPADAFASARAGGLDFFAVSEHAFMLTEVEWQDVITQANAATIDGQFVALPAFEYSNHKGHLNVFGSDSYVHRDDPAYDTLAEFYDWLIAQPTAIAQFNHPQKDAVFDWNFDDFAFNAAADHKIVLQELEKTDQFFLSLNQGWHLGTLKNRDTHQADWGCCPLMGLVASNLTQAAILEAMKAKRTFFVSPNNHRLALVMQANGAWMGSAIPNTGAINFTINAYDSNPQGLPLQIFLYDNGVQVASTSLPPNTVYTWTPAVSGALGHYYYAAAFYAGWTYPAYSSPIWIEQPPIAEAGPAQVVAPGAMASLDGQGSSDPDGDALTYHWVQESGPEVELSEIDTTQPTFIAPETESEVTLRLTVVDPGNLSDTDTTTVTVTNRPVLAIVKDGPTAVKPGDRITYTLTVTNIGLADASNVVITDAVPAGAAYISGGTLLPGNIVAWTAPYLPARGGMVQMTLVVSTNQGIANADYGAACPDCIPASGKRPVITNVRQLYLPIIIK